MMDRTAVKSSNIASVGYDAETRTLEVEFVNGSVHEYNGVEEWVHEELLRAYSVGRHFAQHVRNIYPYRRVA